MGRKKKPSDTQPETLESPCGFLHPTIEEALVHAERNLGMRDSKTNRLVEDLVPTLSGQDHLDGTIIGWQSGSRKRFRLDYDKDYKEKGDLKGTRGVHINEEDFDRRKSLQKVCHPTESPLCIAEQYWRRWSGSFGKRRGTITKEDLGNYKPPR